MSRKLLLATTRSIYTKSNFPIYPLQPRQKNTVLDFLCQHHAPQDSLIQALKLSERETRLMLSDVLDDCLRFPVNFAMYDHNHEMAACKLNTVIDSATYKKFHGSNQKLYSENVKKIIKFTDEIDYPLPLLDLGCNKWLKSAVLAIRPDCEELELARKLWENSFEKSQQLECHGLSAQVSSVSSHKAMLLEMGFKVISTYRYEHFLDKNGGKVFECKDGAVYGQLLVKKWITEEKNKQNSDKDSWKCNKHYSL